MAMALSRSLPPATHFHAVLIGVGGVVLLGAAGLTIASRLGDARADGEGDHAAFEAQQSQAVVLDRVGTGGYALGGALVIGGVVRWIVVGRRAEARSRVAWGPGSGLVVSGRF